MEERIRLVHEDFHELYEIVTCRNKGKYVVLFRGNGVLLFKCVANSFHLMNHHYGFLIVHLLYLVNYMLNQLLPRKLMGKSGFESRPSRVSGASNLNNIDRWINNELRSDSSPV